MTASFQEFKDRAAEWWPDAFVAEDDDVFANDNRPSWAGLCENAITKNVDGPHDMASIRESIKSAERVSAI